jgi:hypothetical protein
MNKIIIGIEVFLIVVLLLVMANADMKKERLKLLSDNCVKTTLVSYNHSGEVSQVYDCAAKKDSGI